MSDTPQTDALIYKQREKALSNVATDFLEMVDWAKKLERALQRRSEEAMRWEFRCRTVERAAQGAK